MMTMAVGHNWVKRAKLPIAMLALAFAQVTSGVTHQMDCSTGEAIQFDARLSVGEKLSLVLPGNERFCLELVEASLSKFGGEVFLGRVEGSDGLLTATVVRGKKGLKITFTSPTDGRIYVIRSSARGTRVRKVNPADFTRSPSPSRIPVCKPSAAGKRRAVRRAQNADPVTVDVLVAYDQGAKDWLAGEDQDAETFAQSAVARMNTALANTGLTSAFRFRLVGTLAVGARSSSIDAVLDAVTEGTGAWRDVSAYRDEVGADIVTTLIDTGSASGVTGQSWSLTDEYGTGDYSWFADSAYNVCSIRSVEISHTMTHEVGHNMGAGHSDLQLTQAGPQLFNYSSGYYFTANGKPYHTIMAYYTDGRTSTFYEEVPFFSSPLHTYEGVAVGNGTHDNTLTLKNTFEQVADFRAAKAEPGEDPEPEPKLEPLTWYTTKSDAFAAAAASGRRILLVWGRDACGNTTATRSYTCEDAAVKAKLLAGYVLWYSDCDTQSSESGRYLMNFAGILPGVSVIDPVADAAIAGTGGYQSVSAMLALLEEAENYVSPEPSPTLADARTEALEAGKLLFVLSGADWCPYTDIVKDYIRSLGSAFTDDFVLYYCNVDTDTTGMADGIPSYGAFDPVEFADNWNDGLLAYGSGGVDERVQKVLDDALDAYAQRTRPSTTQYLITYALQGGHWGTTGNPTTYTAEELPMALPVPERGGQVFMGWVLGDQVIDTLPTGTTGNLWLTATWERIGGLPPDDPDPELEPLTWYRTKSDAFAAAKASGRRILLVWGRDACGNTTATRNYTCEDAAVKAKLLVGYVLWYSDCDTQSSESGRYLMNFAGILPGVSVIDPVADVAIAGAGGYQSVSAMLALLGEAERQPVDLQPVQPPIPVVESMPVDVPVVEPVGAFEAPKATTANGVLVKDGEAFGVLQVKVGKESKTGESKVAVTVIGFDGKKYTAKAEKVPTGGTPTVDFEVKKLGTLTLTFGANGFSGTLNGLAVTSVDATAATAPGKATFAAGNLSSLAGVLTDYLPKDESVERTEKKWKVVAKAGKLKYVKPNEKKGIAGGLQATGSNIAGLKLTYAPKTQTLKGSFKVWIFDSVKHKLKSVSAKVTGIVIDGNGYGLVTVKKTKIGELTVK